MRSALAWHPDKQQLATGSEDGELGVYLVETAQSVPLEGDIAGVSSLAWHPDYEWLATGSQDGTVRVWEVQTNQSLILEEQTHGPSSLVPLGSGWRLGEQTER